MNKPCKMDLLYPSVAPDSLPIPGEVNLCATNSTYLVFPATYDFKKV